MCEQSETTLEIKKIYPSTSELNSIQHNIPCTEEGCDMVFKTFSNFSMHLQKHHKKQELEKTDCVRQYHCPELLCLYHDNLHFTKFKYLKQHFLKVHASKSYVCAKCTKGFSTESALMRHDETCGITFGCSECKHNYSSYESLSTHSKRKKHNILQKSAFTQCKMDPIIISNTDKHTFILPRHTINIVPVVFLKNDVKRIDKECQTENKCKSPIKRKATQQQQTQTVNRKKPRISAETQTTGDCILKLAIQEAKIKMEENKTDFKKCMETQTKNWIKHNQKESQVNLSDLKSEVNLNFLVNDNMMNTSSQTSLNNLNIFEDSSFGNCNSQTQTDLIFQDEFLQSNVFMSHIETQTIEDPLGVGSNMYTQTSDDQLLSELEFTHIQTQTNWPDYDMFVSTETQTLLTHNTKSVLDMALTGREISHMETQTDMEFKQLLEEINA